MTVNSYLTNLAGTAIVRDQEREGIQRSIVTLGTRLAQHFGSQVSNQFVFGSYSRGTILPRSMDINSDIDYMVVFSDSSYQPQTYLDRLRRFVERFYVHSEIKQSTPTIILSLNHIHFELVPAIENWWSGLQIPASASCYQNWIDTDPTGFNDELTRANQSHNNLIKPLVRLIKYWNAKNKYPFESYSLEQDIVRHGFGFYGLFTQQQLKDLFFDFIGDMNAGIFIPQWKREAIDRAKQLADRANSLDSSGYIVEAEKVIKGLIPPVATGLLGRRL